jgi:hypothetical protein
MFNHWWCSRLNDSYGEVKLCTRDPLQPRDLKDRPLGPKKGNWYSVLDDLRTLEWVA